MTAVQGGNFWNGFAAGSISSIAGSLWQGGFNHEGLDANGKMINPTEAFGGIDGTSTASMIAFGTIAGGAGAALTGGNFWQGAVTGLIVSGLNHAMHQMGNEDGMGDGDPKPKPKQSKPTFKQLVAIERGVVSTISKIHKSSYLNLLRAGGVTAANPSNVKLLQNVGKGLGYLSIAVETKQYFNNEISGLELSVDSAMTLVGLFGGPVGAGISISYSLGKMAYNYYNPDNPLFAKPKNQ